MEGEAQVVTEAPVTSEPVQATETTVETNQEAQPVQQTETPQAKPDGFDAIDVRTATPEQIEARIGRLYKNMKRYETDSRDFRQANEILANQIQELRNHQGQIVNHLQTEDFKSAEQQLKDQRALAWKNGNSDSYDEANDKLRELSVRKAMAEMQPPKQQQIQQPYLPKVSGEAVLERATQQGVISPEEATTYRGWMDESDGYGNPKRPWINETDSRNPQAAAIGKAVFNSPAMQNKTFGDKLREIDRLMGIQQPQANQNVLPGGNLTPPRKNNNIKVTDYEAKIAIKTKFGGSKAKSESDHIEAWRQAKIKSQQKGASR